MDELLVLSSSINLREIPNETVQTQLFNIQNILKVLSEFKEHAKSEEVKKMDVDVNDVKKLENFLKDHKNPLVQDTYHDLMNKLRSIRKKMEEVESQSLASLYQQISHEEEQDNSTIIEDEGEDEEDMKVRLMIRKLMSSTKNSIRREDRNFISKVLLEYIELKRKHNQ